MIPSQNGNQKENYEAHQEVTAQAQLGSSTESKVLMETTRTTSATMRMEHKTSFPDLPITFSQRTQTPTIPLVSEGTTTETTKSQTEATQTQSEPTKAPLVQAVPFPFVNPPVSSAPPVAQRPEAKNSALEFFESNLKNLQPLQEEKYTRYEDMVRGNKTYVHKQNDVKEIFQSKLNEDLSYFNLVPEPPPEMGFMPKVQKPQPERLVEKVKKLEEVHQSSETPLSGTVFPQSFKKEEKFEKKEFLSTSSVSTSPFVQQKPVQRSFTPQMNTLFTADPRVTRSPSPKPSTEAVNMEKLWSMKPKSPEHFSQHQQQSFSHEHKSSFVAYSSQQMHVQQTQKQETLPLKEQFVPIQAYNAEPQNQEELPKTSIKDTKSFFEQRIKQEEVKPMQTELKAPGLVRQFAKPMVPLVPLDLEPGEPPEMCYAPKPVYERKQSYVEKIEKTLEQNLEKEPDRVPRGGVRILPQRQTPQRSIASQSPQRYQAAPSPKPQPPAEIQQVLKPETSISHQPIIAPEPFVPQLSSFEQYQSKEFKTESFDIKKNISTVDSGIGYRHVEPPKFLQGTDRGAIPPIHQFEMPKLPEPFVPKFEPVTHQYVPPPKPEPVKQFVTQPQPDPVKQYVAPPKEVSVPIQKQEPVKPVLQQHQPVSQPRPFVKAKAKFNEFAQETSDSHSLYKNFVRSEESTHSSESYFQKIEQSKIASPPLQQFKKQEPPKQQFVPPPQQVRKKYLPDVML